VSVSSPSICRSSTAPTHAAAFGRRSLSVDSRFEPSGDEAIKMATSILDYLFRELVISYLDRGNLAHVQPGDLMPDTVGRARPNRT
jgi:hypothetical protein